MVRVWKLTGIVVLVATTLGLFGCGQMSTAPDPNAAVTAQTSPSAALGPAPPTTDGFLGPILDPLLRPLVGLIVRVLNVVGSVGGSLSNGRWRLDVPADAIDGSARVAMGIRDAASGTCELEIAPASKNRFARPVMLTVDCSSVPSARLARYVVLWFNPATGEWEPVEGSRVDLANKTVSAPLTHFSKYSVGPADGKAGW